MLPGTLPDTITADTLPDDDDLDGWISTLEKVLDRNRSLRYREIVRKLGSPKGYNIRIRLKMMVKLNKAQEPAEDWFRLGAPAAVATDTVDAAALQRTIEEQSTEIQELKNSLEDSRKTLSDITSKPQGPISLVVKNEKTGKKVKIKRAHFMFPSLLRRVKLRINVFLVGPAGSGKTTVAAQVAEALALDFGFMSVGPQTTKSDIFGFISAGGKYIETEFRRRYENGGVFLFDEIDAANAGVLTQINAALANEHASFPDGLVKKHPDFRCIAAGNTFGTGPDRQYVGRQELDAASLDRFNFLEWPYDEGLELDIAKSLDETHAVTWVPYVQRVRRVIQSLGIRLVVSPRCSFEGVKLLSDGEDLVAVQKTQLWKSLKPTEIERICSQLTDTN